MGWKTENRADIFRYGGKQVVPTAQGGADTPMEAKYGDYPYFSASTGEDDDSTLPKAKLPMGYNAQLVDIDDESR